MLGSGGAGASSGWRWENAAAGAIAGFATVAALHPLDVVRTRFQVNDGRVSNLPSYRSTGNALYTIARTEGFRGLYSGFHPAVLGSTASWGLYFLFYNKAKQRYYKGTNKQLSPGHHLVSAAEASALVVVSRGGQHFIEQQLAATAAATKHSVSLALDKAFRASTLSIACIRVQRHKHGQVCLFTNPVWLVKTRLQLQPPGHPNQPYSGFYDALRTIQKEEGWRAFYKGIGPGLLLVSHGAIQFTVYEELRKIFVRIKSPNGEKNQVDGDKVLNSFDYATLGASSKVAAIMLTYPYQVIRSRLQQRPSNDGIPKYLDGWHVVKETFRFEGIRGFYKGITSSLLKNAPAASLTFVVYENVLSLLSLVRRQY